jgi:hypothetical protein
MKTKIIIIAFSLLGFVYACPALAAKARLTWNANTESDLAGYKVYWGTQSGNYTNNQDAGNVATYYVNDISNTGTTYFAVTAYDTSNNESDRSAEVKKTPGDVNSSGAVNLSDFNVLAINFGNFVANCNQSGNYNQADINLDCYVNLSDFNALAMNFGYSSN